jgi:hypothetical protein
VLLIWLFFLLFERLSTQALSARESRSSGLSSRLQVTPRPSARTINSIATSGLKVKNKNEALVQIAGAKIVNL